MALPEIHSVRIYQAVTFNKRSETFFSANDINSKSGKAIKINSELGGVEIKDDMDHVFIPFTNVSCIYFMSEIKKQQADMAEDAKTKVVGVKPSEIKKPK